MRRGVSGFDSVSGGGKRVCQGRRRLRLLVLLLGWNRAVSKDEVSPDKKVGEREREEGLRVVDVRLHLPRLVDRIRVPSRPGLALL